MVMVAAIAFLAQQVPETLPLPPPIFDLLLSIVFAWLGWLAWRKGKGWRSGALVMWLLTLGGLWTYSRSF